MAPVLSAGCSEDRGVERRCFQPQLEGEGDSVGEEVKRVETTWWRKIEANMGGRAGGRLRSPDPRKPSALVPPIPFFL